MENQINLGFNPKNPTIMHIDINSCFATIEQQANPRLRGKPIVVAAYASPGGCILAASIEAKRFGIKTGMRVREALPLYPKLIILSPDPDKYRYVHRNMKKLLLTYTNKVTPRSIDEFVIDMENYPLFQKGMLEVGKDIKRRINKEIGDWIKVSIGIAPNRFLAKTAASLKKPDGLEVIDINNYKDVYAKLKLTDLCGIKRGNERRLNSMGIYTMNDFYESTNINLKKAMRSINGYYWYLRLRGWEIDDIPEVRKSFGHSYALPVPFIDKVDLLPILQKLVEKMGRRLRKHRFLTKGIHLGILYKDHTYWHKGVTTPTLLFDSRDLFNIAVNLLEESGCSKPVRNIAVTCFKLGSDKKFQLNLLENTMKKYDLTKAVDEINEKWGDFAITPARMLTAKNLIPDRIAFFNSSH